MSAHIVSTTRSQTTLAECITDLYRDGDAGRQAITRPRRPLPKVNLLEPNRICVLKVEPTRTQRARAHH